MSMACYLAIIFWKSLGMHHNDRLTLTINNVASKQNYFGEVISPFTAKQFEGKLTA